MSVEFSVLSFEVRHSILESLNGIPTQNSKLKTQNFFLPVPGIHVPRTFRESLR
jgi:hypothetical protein